MKLKGIAIASAAAAMLMGCGAPPKSPAANSKDEVKCQGINECKGTSECASKDGNSCQGLNSCKGQGWITSPSAQECTQKGGKVLA